MNKLFENKLLDTAFKDGTLSTGAMDLEQKQILRAKLLSKLKRDAKEDFYSYVLLMAPVTLSEEFVNGKHIKLIANKLMQVENSVVLANEERAMLKGKGKPKFLPKKLQIFLPPGAMKSKLVSILFVAWCFGRHPWWNILQLGHSTVFAIDNFGRQVREILMSEEHSEIFPEPQARLKKNAKSAQSFELVGKGRYYCAGGNAKISGRRAHLLVCDDVVSEKEAYSDTLRNKINKWYLSGVRSRKLSIGAELIVNTRWALEDLSGFLEKTDKNSRPWEIVKFPALLDAEAAVMLDLPEGTSFWPELWPTDYFLDMQSTMLPSEFSALYQQNPIPAEGTLVKDSYIKDWTEEEGADVDEEGNVVPPYVEAVICSLDTAFSEKKRADNSAYTIWGLFYRTDVGKNGMTYTAPNIILLGSGKGQWSFPTLKSKLEGIEEDWAPNFYVIEDKASGQSLIQDLQFAQLPIFKFNPGKDDKMTRMQTALSTMVAGRVWMPKSRGYAKDVLTELLQFPVGKKDLADTVSQAILWFRGNGHLFKSGDLGYEQYADEDRYKKKKTSTYWSVAAAN